MKKIIVLGLTIAIAVMGVVAYAFFKPPQEASGPIEAISVGVEENTSPARTPAPESVAEPVIFEIVQAESEARFIIDEVLNGAPNTVVGATDQVAGEIAIYVSDPASSKIGAILVNARTLATDNQMRDRAIKNRILFTDANEFITFTPTQIVGLPDNVSVGASFSFQIVGDLTVRDVTHPVTFNASITPLSETRLEGLATATILYADFGLAIPQVPSVASVSDEVKLEIEFVAVAK